LKTPLTPKRNIFSKIPPLKKGVHTSSLKFPLPKKGYMILQFEIPSP